LPETDSKSRLSSQLAQENEVNQQSPGVHHLQTLYTETMRDLSSSGYAKTSTVQVTRLSGEITPAKYSFANLEEFK